MNFSSTQKKSTWLKQTAIVVSESPNVHMLLRELLRSYQWTVTESTQSLDYARDAIRTGQAHLLIIDDTLVKPAARHLRTLLGDPVTVLTPVLSFLLEPHRQESVALAKLGRPQLVEKPLTPAKFVPGFLALVKIWERDAFVAVRKAQHLLLNGQEPQGLRALLKLMEIAEVQTLCAQALALYLRRQDKVKEAESLLLTVMKRSPRDLGTMVSLADLYLHAAMPKLAHRLLLGARAAYPQALVVLPDLVQAALMMGQLGDALATLSLMQESGLATDHDTAVLARLFFAEGREGEAERLLVHNKALFKKIQASWTVVDGQPQATPAAS